MNKTFLILGICLLVVSGAFVIAENFKPVLDNGNYFYNNETNLFYARNSTGHLFVIGDGTGEHYDRELELVKEIIR